MGRLDTLAPVPGSRNSSFEPWPYAIEIALNYLSWPWEIRQLRSLCVVATLSSEPLDWDQCLLP